VEVASSAPTPGPTGPAPLPPTAEPTTEARVVLRPDGLAFTDGGSSASFLTFGTDGETVRTARDDALGQGGEMPSPDCGDDAVTVRNEILFLQLQAGEFVGWVTGSPGLTTAEGIGSTLVELRAAFPRALVGAVEEPGDPPGG
jgi:hypothetical protein